MEIHDICNEKIYICWYSFRFSNLDAQSQVHVLQYISQALKKREGKKILRKKWKKYWKNYATEMSETHIDFLFDNMSIHHQGFEINFQDVKICNQFLWMRKNSMIVWNTRNWYLLSIMNSWFYRCKRWISCTWKIKFLNEGWCMVKYVMNFQVPGIFLLEKCLLFLAKFVLSTSLLSPLSF